MNGECMCQNSTFLITDNVNVATPLWRLGSV